MNGYRAIHWSILLILIGGCDDDGCPGPSPGVATSVDGRSVSGSLDKTFATDGVLSLNLGPWKDDAAAIAVDADGVYLTGQVQIQKTSKLSEGYPIVWKGRIEKRRRSDGTGMWSPGIDTDFTAVRGISLAPDALYLFGSRRYGGSIATYGRIEKRSRANGSLIWEPDAPASPLREIVGLCADSTALYAAGVDQSLQGKFRWGVEKRRSNDGRVLLSVASDATVNAYYHAPTAVVRDSDALYIAGYQYVSTGNYQWRIEKRSLADLHLIPGFGENGVVTSNPSSGSDAPWAVALDDSGLYVVGDESQGPGKRQWRIEKRDRSDGKLVAAFGNAGTIQMGESDRSWASAVLADSGAIYVAGSQENQFRVEKRNSTDGKLTASFGTGGFLLTALAPKSGIAAALAADSTRLYIAGSDNLPEADLKKVTDMDYQWRVEARFK